VVAAKLVRDTFSDRASGCGWVQFRNAAQASDVIHRCNVTAIYIVGALRSAHPQHLTRAPVCARR
jgi:hypothetical protein